MLCYHWDYDVDLEKYKCCPRCGGTTYYYTRPKTEDDYRQEAFFALLLRIEYETVLTLQGTSNDI